MTKVTVVQCESGGREKNVKWYRIVVQVGEISLCFGQMCGCEHAERVFLRLLLLCRAMKEVQSFLHNTYLRS
jgi:hypothetical protein